MIASFIKGFLSVILEILILFPGCGRTRAAREIGPDEGIEDDLTVDFYENENRKLPFRLLRKYILYLLKTQKPKGTLVDLGCGPGQFTEDIARAFPGLKITALDISPLMLERAREILAGYDITYEQGDIGNLPFPENSFDFVISTLSLHHWTDPAEGFAEIHRILKPGGQFLVFDTRRDAPRLFYFLLKQMQRWIMSQNISDKNEPTSSVMASYTPAEAKGFLKNLPLEEKKVSGGIFWITVTGRKRKV